MTWAEARKLGLKHYFTGKPCGAGHIAKRKVSSRNCAVCSQKSVARWQAKNGAKCASYSAQWRAANPEKAADAVLSWRQRHPDYQAAIEGMQSARRRGAVIPADFDVRTTVAVYAKARALTESTGIEHQVDHIVAAYHGGTHTLENLQILTKNANVVKSNSTRNLYQEGAFKS